MPTLTLDAIAPAGFLIGWSLYGWLVTRSRFSRRAISAEMSKHRQRWMAEMAEMADREPRIVDSQLLASLMQGVGFLASTAVLMVGVLTAMLGLSEAAFDFHARLPAPFAVPSVDWRLKILLVTMVFVFAFFKFLWCYRLFNYCAILIGATPPPGDPDIVPHVRRLGDMQSLAAEHFNSGLRGYYFGLAALGWLVHPLLLLLSTAAVLAILWRRDFASRSLAILRQS